MAELVNVESMQHDTNYYSEDECGIHCTLYMFYSDQLQCMCCVVYSPEWLYGRPQVQV